MWEYVPNIYCPGCAARSVWAGPHEKQGRVGYCVRCNSRVVLKLTPVEYLNPREREELTEARHAASVDSNSAIGAFR